MSTTHALLGGKLHVYKRENSSAWQCSTFLNGRNHRRSTKTDSLAEAKDIAEDWFYELKGQAKRGEIRGGGVTFKKAADEFLREVEALLTDERGPTYVAEHRWRLKVHLVPFFGKRGLSEITPGLVQEYRIHRMTSRIDHRTMKPLLDPDSGRPVRDANGHIVKDPNSGTVLKPSRSTMHKEIVTLRQVLKCANRRGWLPYLPDLSTPFRGSGKISHRAWFSPAEYKRLYEATRKRVENPPKPRWRRSYEQLHDYVLFMVNTGLRPDEAARLEFRDVEIVRDEATGEQILEIEVRGKRGVGYCKSMPGAVVPFKRLRERLRPADAGRASGRTATARSDGLVKPRPTDRLFDGSHRELLKTILDEEGMTVDRDGNRRTAYSLRHTYICLRLLEGADIYQLAKNCRTSVEMIEKFYASHLKNMLDASAINVRKPKARKGPVATDRDDNRKPPSKSPANRRGVGASR
jgi:integrase